MHQTFLLLLSVSFFTMLGACGSQNAALGNPDTGSPSDGGAGTAGSSNAPNAGSSPSAPTAGAGSAGMAAGGGSSLAGDGAGSAGLGAGSGGLGVGGDTNPAGGSSGAAAGSAGSGVNQANLPATTLHLAGDSTVMTYAADSAQEGWGQELGLYFTSKVTIDNRALGGASIQTFQSRWTGIVSSLKAGDFVMADFGINDSGGVSGRGVSTADFKTFMSQMNTQVKAKQATFIIVTPSALQYWSGTLETNARLAPYVAVENSLGMTDKIPVDDLNARSLEFLNMIGQTAAKQIYINGDKAHFTKMGATQMAKFVATELQRIGSPLAGYLK
jgi:lysophospholipase L1-like esterase